MRLSLQLIGLVFLCSTAELVTADQGAATLSLGLGKVFTFFFLTLGPAHVIAPFARSTAALDGNTRRRVAFAATGIARSTYLAPTMIIIASVLAVLQAALGVQLILSGLKLAGVTD